MSKRAVLITKYIQPDEINNEFESMIPKVKYTFFSPEEVENAGDKKLRYSAELSNSKSKTAWIPYHELIFNPGFIAMNLQNIQPANGPVNGFCYSIKSIKENVPFLRAVAVKHNKRRFTLSCTSCDSGYDYFRSLDSV